MFEWIGYPETRLIVLIPGVLYAAWIDYFQRRVPNWLNAALAVSGLAAQTVFFGWDGLADGFLGLLVGFGLLIGFWVLHGMGAGDVKLMAAIGAWLGPWLTLVAFAAGAVIGGVIVVVLIVLSRWWRWYVFALLEAASVRDIGERNRIPYGVPLVLGTLLLLTSSYFGWVPVTIIMKGELP
jgi:prepilin peptidase CpaA